MTAPRGKSLIIAGGVVALSVIVAAVFVILFDIDHYKPKIETAASAATGLAVRINGKMGLSIFPFGVSAQDIHVAGKGGEILSLESFTLGMKLMSLLAKQLDVSSCELVKPVVTIVKDVKGRYNFAGTEHKSTKDWLKAAASLHELRLSKGSLVYLDMKTGEKTELKEFNLALKDILPGDAPGDIIKNASFTGSLDCKELLLKDFRIENIKVPVKAVRGLFNFQPLAIGTLVYSAKKGDEKTELKEIHLAIKDLSLRDTSGEMIKNVSFSGNVECQAVRKKNLKIDNVKSPVIATKGVIHLMPLTMDIFGAKGEGDATADMSGVFAAYTINLKVSKLDFTKLEESFGAKKLIGGKGDLHASLTMKEKGSRDLMRNVDGTLSLRGENLVIYTMDLDKVLSKYETSQQFNLVDLGAFFIAGPLGTVALRGYHYGDVYNQTRGGQGVITRLSSHWKIKNGVADARDCALATHHNRVALKGKLDFVGKRYENVVVALLDDKGCAKFKQSISGSFGKPQIGTVSTAESLVGPIIDLYRKAKRLVQGGKCEVFYQGSVQQPH